MRDAVHAAQPNRATGAGLTGIAKHRHARRASLQNLRGVGDGALLKLRLINGGDRVTHFLLALFASGRHDDTGQRHARLGQHKIHRYRAIRGHDDGAALLRVANAPHGDRVRTGGNIRQGKPAIVTGRSAECGASDNDLRGDDGLGVLRVSHTTGDGSARLRDGSNVRDQRDRESGHQLYHAEAQYGGSLHTQSPRAEDGGDGHCNLKCGEGTETPAGDRRGSCGTGQ